MKNKTEERYIGDELIIEGGFIINWFKGRVYGSGTKMTLVKIRKTPCDCRVYRPAGQRFNYQHDLVLRTKEVQYG
jgi:hypothetical protein